MPLFSPLGTPPNSGDPATFNNRTDTLLGQLPTMVSQFNNLGPLLMTKYRADRSGTANTIVLTAGYDSLPVGTQVRFRAGSANTGATTINLDGLGSIACRTITGAVLPAGYIRTDADTVATYDGTFWVLDREDERGTNSNGFFLRLANGYQSCYGVGVSLTSTVSDTSVTFPAAFASAPPTVQMVGQSGSVRVPVLASNPTTSGFSCNLFDASGNRQASTLRWSALGEWY